jgi:hypothetical protein
MKGLYSLLFSANTRAKLERLTVTLSIVGFFTHLALIGLGQIWSIELFEGRLLQNPINAIYTPFSFILIYEIYLLIFYLPRSFTTSLLKQFEVISLIMVRRVFGDITKIEFAEVEFNDPQLTALLIDLGAVLIMALAILLFIKAKNKLKAFDQPDMVPGEQRFNSLKKSVSAVLLVILGGISMVHLCDFVIHQATGAHLIASLDNNLDAIFYKDFFTTLILADVLILLLSYALSQDYFKLIRNTGFVITTILLRLSFGAAQPLDVLLIITGALFGYLMLLMYIAYSRELQTR